MQRLVPWLLVVLSAACAASAEPPPRAPAVAPLAVVTAEAQPAQPAQTAADPAATTGAESAVPGDVSATAETAAATAASEALTEQPVARSEPLPADGEPSIELVDVADAEPADPADGPVPGDPLPDPSPTVVRFVPFGANPGTSAADFDDVSAMLSERYHGETSAEREASLDAALSAYHVVDRTPAWINQVNGLDMSDPADVVLARLITNDWYLAQERYKKVALNGDPTDMSERAVNGRVTVLRAWVRYWQGELERGTVERYRSRLDDLVREMERLRAQRRAGAAVGGDG